MPRLFVAANVKILRLAQIGQQGLLTNVFTCIIMYSSGKKTIRQSGYCWQLVQLIQLAKGKNEMFNQATKQYTVVGHDGSFDWIVEGVDAAIISEATAKEWAERVIATAKEAAIMEMSASAEEMTFPKMGYSTTHVYKSFADYVDQKTAEITADLEAEKLAIVAFLLAWNAVNYIKEGESIPVAKTTVLFKNEDGTYSVTDNGEEVVAATEEEAIQFIVENLTV